MCQNSKKVHARYSDEERLNYVRSYYSSGMSKRSFCKQNGITSTVMLRGWIKKFSNCPELLSLQQNQDESDMAKLSNEEYREQNIELKKRIKALEKALAFSKLETEARDLMITRAEEYFNIPIRKKPGAK